MNFACGGGSSSVFSSALNACVREHVDFVEDIDLVARLHRRVADRVVDLAHVVDAVVRGRVHLDHVEVPAFHDRLAVHAQHRHLDGRACDRAVGQLVIERTREDARGGGLADAAHAGEDPGLRDAPGLERVRDRAHHRVLADQVVEIRRPVFARQHAVGLVRDRSAAGRSGSGASTEPFGRSRRRSLAGSAPVRRVRRLEMKRWEADERPEPELVRAASFRT